MIEDTSDKYLRIASYLAIIGLTIIITHLLSLTMLAGTAILGLGFLFGLIAGMLG